MDDVFHELARSRGGYFFRADALEAGLDDRTLRRALRGGLIVRPRHGTYVPSDLAQTLSAGEKQLVLGRSVLQRSGPGGVLCAETALMIHTGHVWGLDADELHVNHSDGWGRRNEAGVRYHCSAVSQNDVVLVDDVPVMQPARALIEVATRHSTEVAMVHFSLALRAGVVTVEDLHSAMGRFGHWPEMTKVRLAVGWAEPRCENVVELRSMFVFRHHGLPLPVPQVTVYDLEGRPIGRVDFDWEQFRHIGEVDGAAKYADYAEPGSPASVLVTEKWREDQLRATLRGVSRWGWVDLNHQAQLAARISHDLERSRRLYVVSSLRHSSPAASRPIPG